MRDAARARGRSVILVVVAALPVLGLLLFLGTWQVQRLHWKNDLIARIAAAETGPARPMGDPPEMLSRVTLSGVFDHVREVSLGVEVRNNVLGTQIVTPLLRAGAPPVLVVRGWVPLDPPAPVARPARQVEIEGWVRPGETAGFFAAADDPAAKRFYTFDPAAIGAALGMRQVERFGIVALAETAEQRTARFPEPARTLPRPVNNHLGYAVTWYGLALALVGVLVAHIHRTLRPPPPPRRRAIRLLRDPNGD